MSYCINKNNPQYKLNLMTLTKLIGNSSAAIAALELNNGYSLDKTATGKNSILYNTYLDYVRKQFPEMTEQE